SGRAGASRDHRALPPRGARAPRHRPGARGRADPRLRDPLGSDQGRLTRRDLVEQADLKLLEAPGGSGLQLDVPVEKVRPALMQEVGRKRSAVLLQPEGCRLHRLDQRRHTAFLRQAVPLDEIAALTGGDDVIPGGTATSRTGQNMVEGQIFGGVAFAAVLALEAVAQKNVETREGRPPVQVNILLQGDDARQTHAKARGMDLALILGEDIDAIEKDRLDRILPSPERQRKVTQGTEVRIEHQCREAFDRSHLPSTRSRSRLDQGGRPQPVYSPQLAHTRNCVPQLRDFADSSRIGLGYEPSSLCGSS